jgi:tetratricopeptide (TPR) repeat protein
VPVSHPRRLRPFGVLRILCIALLLGGLLPAVAAAYPGSNGVPAGAAANWALGRRLLADGDAAGAVDLLHIAYRMEPDEPLIAMDLQEAFALTGYVSDAVEVMDRLIAAHPDSLDWRLRRSGLLLRLNRPNDALGDLKEIRSRGGATVGLVGAEARILAGLGRPAEALDVCREALVTFPEDRASIYMEMIDILQQEGDVAAADRLIAEGVAAEPQDPGLRLVQIRTLAAAGRNDEALAAARKADRELSVATAVEVYDPETGEVLMHPAPGTTASPPADGFQVELADFHARHGRTTEAVAVLQPLAAAGELNLQPSLWLARLLLASGRIQEGAAQVAAINGRWPESGRGWFLRGRLAESRSDWPAALGFHRQAVELDGGDPELRVALVRAMLVAWEADLTPHAAGAQVEARRADLAEQTEAAAAILPEGDSQGHLVLGYAAYGVGKLEQAISHFAAAAPDRDVRRSALLQQSVCYDELGLPDEARRALELLHRENPGDATVANALGYFLAEKGQDIDLADQLVSGALEAEPANGAYLDSMGWVRYRQGRLDDALDYLIRAVNALPDDPIILEHLGTVLGLLGQHAESGNALRRALDAGGDPARLRPAIAAADSAAGGRP